MIRGQVIDTQVSSRNGCFCLIFCEIMCGMLFCKKFYNNNLSSGIRAHWIVGFLSQPIKKQVRICNSFSDSIFGIKLVYCTSSATAPDRIHMDRPIACNGPLASPDLRHGAKFRITAATKFTSKLPKWAPAHGQQLGPPMTNRCNSGL